jgi:hypothetical protein
MAEDGGVEPHPISQNPVFKAGRSTNTAASSSVTLVPDSGNDPLAYRLSSDCSTSELIGNILVLPVGIEPTSMVLQTTAMTTSAKAASILWGDYWELNPDKRNHNPRLYH